VGLAAPALIILDRDGTLVEGPPPGDYLIDPSDVRLVGTMVARVRGWNHDGVRVVVATNQRCVALGLATEADVSAVHARIEELLAEEGARVDAWYVCTHGLAECDCRKPAPGMLLRAMADAGVGPAQTAMIGDADADAGAARAAGVSFERVG